MSCLPQTPVADYITTTPNNDGWVGFSSIATSPTALSQYFGVAAEVLTFSAMAQTTNQHLKLLQVEVEETASSSANIKKAGLRVYLYTDAAPTTPATNAVYNGSTTDLMCSPVLIATADYVRVSDTVWTATVQPNRIIRTGTTSTATNIYVVVLADTSVTYAASAALRVKLTVANHTAV